jgi:hypothetical protein
VDRNGHWNPRGNRRVAELIETYHCLSGRDDRSRTTTRLSGRWRWRRTIGF